MRLLDAILKAIVVISVLLLLLFARLIHGYL
jgi:hypothetical protein